MPGYGAPFFPQGIPWATEDEAARYVPPVGPPTVIFVRGSDKIHLISQDQFGQISRKILRYEEIQQEPPAGNYVTKDDFSTFVQDLRKELQPLFGLIPTPAQTPRPAPVRREENPNG